MSFVPSIGALDRADLCLSSALHSQKFSLSLLRFVRLHNLFVGLRNAEKRINAHVYERGTFYSYKRISCFDCEQGARTTVHVL